MSFETGTYKIEELINMGLLEIGDGYRAKNSELSNVGIPFARAANINDGFKFNNADYFPHENLFRVGHKISKVGDVVFTSKGTVGRFALVNEKTQQFVYSPQLCFWRSLDHSKLLPEYLYYWMNSSEFLHQIGYLKGQTDMADYVSLRDQRQINATVPDATEQDLLVQVMKPLDNRISLLRETNTTLEAIAQTLFKSWFVDFDPVKAKAEGCLPEGMDEATAALFPSEFEESALGLIPKGWRVGIIQELGEVICGKTPPTAQPENYGDEVPFITIPDMHNVLLVTSTNRSLSKLGADTQKKKYLPVGSICVSCIATAGLVARVTVESQTNQQINSVVPFDKWGKSFPLFILRRIGDAVRAGGSGGSIFHNLNKSSFEQLSILLPNEILAHKFEIIVEPIIHQIENNQKQSQTLTTLRDTLLPRLISGQLRLNQAQEIMDEVGA